MNTSIRGRRRGTSFGSAASSISNTPISAPWGAARNADATPLARLAPLRLATTSMPSDARIDWSIDAVVVFPFVPETTTIPLGSAPARRDTKSWSNASMTRPGTVVPAPIRSTRDRRPTPRAKRSATAPNPTRLQFRLIGAPPRSRWIGQRRPGSSTAGWEPDRPPVGLREQGRTQPRGRGIPATGRPGRTGPGSRRGCIRG